MFTRNPVARRTWSHVLIAAVVERELDGAVDLACAPHRAARRDRHGGQAIDQPGGAGGTDGTRTEAILRLARKASPPVRRGDELADTCRADVCRRVQDPAHEVDVVRPPGGLAEPVHHIRAYEHLRGRTALVEQRRGLERALPSADHDHALAREDRQVGVLGRVRDELGPQAAELRRTCREWLDAGGDDDPRRLNLLAVAERRAGRPRRRARPGRRDARRAPSAKCPANQRPYSTKSWSGTGFVIFFPIAVP